MWKIYCGKNKYVFEAELYAIEAVVCIAVREGRTD